MIVSNQSTPLGSVMEFQPFIIYINNLDEEIKCIVANFTDDTKKGGVASY